MNDSTRPHVWFDRLMIAGFVIALWLPLLATVAGRGETISTLENRELARWPAWGLQSQTLGELTKQYQQWWNDHFGLRTQLLKGYGRLGLRRLETPSFGLTIEGKDGWIFYGREAVRTYRCLVPFTPAELEAWQRRLEERRDWLQAQGVAYVFFIAPNKHTIYPEHLPDWVTRVGERSRFDQFLEHMRRESDVRVVDVRPAILEAKAQGQTYFRTDTHWTSLGAYAATRELIDRLSSLPQLAALRPLELSGYRVHDAAHAGDVARLSMLYGSTPELVTVLEPPASVTLRREGELYIAEQLDAEHASLPSAVLVGDSFAERMLPVLAPHFRRVVLLPSVGGAWTAAAIMEREKPDLVLQEVVERNF